MVLGRLLCSFWCQKYNVLVANTLFFFKCSHHPKLDFFYKKVFLCIFYFMDQLWKYLQKSRQTNLSSGNKIFDGVFPITWPFCGVAWGISLWVSACSLPVGISDVHIPRCFWPPWLADSPFKWDFPGTFLWHYAIAENTWWKVKKFRDWFVLFLTEQYLEVRKPGGKFRILLEEPDWFQVSLLLTQTSSWPCFSG